MFLLLLLPLCMIQILSACTYTPVEWLSHQNLVAEKATNQTLCRVNWFQLLEINVAQMRVKENQLWVVVAQQYIGASLNKLRLDSLGRNISESILYLGNTLEYYCDNISLWKLQEKEDIVLGILYDFNHGLFPEYPLCDKISIPRNGSEGEESDTFFYYQTIDTFIVRDYVSNQTISRSEYIGIINTNMSLSLSLGFLILWLFICFLKMVIDGNARKRYRLWKNQSSHSLGEESLNKNPLYVNEKDITLTLSSDDNSLL